MKKFSLIIVLLLQAFPFKASGATLIGDVDDDGAVEISDVTTLIEYLLTDDTTGINLQNADVNQDGQVDIADVSKLIDVLLLMPANPHPDSDCVDLGLPSGTLWATCNVGASAPEEYGDYFAWGETAPKDYYDWSTYIWCNGNGNTLTKYCTNSSYGYNGFVDNKTELDPEDDAAYINWGTSWRTPTQEQQKELCEQCTWTWTTRNSVNGYLVTGPNGKTMFLPASGGRWYDSLYYDGTNGDYWSRTCGSGSDASILIFDSGFRSYRGSGGRCIGLTVRAVRVSSDPQPQNETFTVNGVTFTMVPVEGGTFMMGPTAEQGSSIAPYEKPVHQVSLSSFCIGQTEVTQALWQAVMGNNPSGYTGDLNRPVELVSWDDCQLFISKLNELTGKQFRLPTEAEWEFAARGGNKTQSFMYSGSNDINEVAWYTENSGEDMSSRTTHPVGSKKSNELGLYDMSGNVKEWCQDFWAYYSSSAQTNPTGPVSGSGHVCRGGCIYGSADICRVSYRYYERGPYNDLGLRLALDMDDSPKFRLSKSVVSIEVNKSKSVEILNGNGEYTITSGTNNVSTSVEGNSVIVTGIQSGTTTLYITDTSTGFTAVLNVIVTVA